MIKKLIVGLTDLAGFSGSCCSTPFIKHEPLVNQLDAPTYIDIGVDKAKTGIGLKCEQVDRITTQGYSFYTCHDDIDFDLVKRMELVAAVKQFTRDNLGFKDTDNYKVYKNNKDEKATTYYRLYVTGKFNIPETWDGHRVWIEVDSQHYVDIGEGKLFSSAVDKLIDEKKNYISKGYDTYWRSFSSFEGGCNLSPEFFEDSIADQISTIIHEDFHCQTDKQSEIEESMATIVGMTGAVEFTKEYFGEGSKEHKLAQEWLQSWLTYSRFVGKYYYELEGLYAKEMPLEEKMREKRVIQEQAEEERSWLNNASIWDKIPYTKNFPLAYQIYLKHPDMGELVKILLASPKDEKGAVKYLENLLEKE